VYLRATLARGFFGSLYTSEIKTEQSFDLFGATLHQPIVRISKHFLARDTANCTRVALKTKACLLTAADLICLPVLNRSKLSTHLCSMCSVPDKDQPTCLAVLSFVMPFQQQLHMKTVPLACRVASRRTAPWPSRSLTVCLLTQKATKEDVSKGAKRDLCALHAHTGQAQPVPPFAES